MNPAGRLVPCLPGEVLATFLVVFPGIGAVQSAVLAGAQAGIWQVAVVWGAAAGAGDLQGRQQKDQA